MLFPVFPEPEIDLEPGSDLEAELVQPVALPADLPAVDGVAVLEDDANLDRSLAGIPERTLTKKGKEADVVNIVFAGTREQVEQAFEAAGWVTSEPVSPHTVIRQFYSYLAKTSYHTAPMSAQLLDNRSPELTLEKSLQSPEKRNHLRIWALDSTWEGRPLWASAAVRETGATLSVRHRGFIHHVAEDVGEEQQTVVRDLTAAGCVDAAGSIPRPDMEHVMQNATGDFFRTDGSLQVILLKPCSSTRYEQRSFEAGRTKPGSKLYRYARREILTVRSDVWRANCIYALFDLTRMTVEAIQRNSAHRAEVSAFQQSAMAVPVSPTKKNESEGMAPSVARVGTLP